MIGGSVSLILPKTYLFFYFINLYYVKETLLVKFKQLALCNCFETFGRNTYVPIDRCSITECYTVKLRYYGHIWGDEDYVGLWEVLLVDEGIMGRHIDGRSGSCEGFLFGRRECLLLTMGLTI